MVETVLEKEGEDDQLLPPRIWNGIPPANYPGYYTPVTPATPTAFETRNTGATLEVEPVIDADGVHIDLNIAPQHVEFLGYQLFPMPKDKDITGADGKDSRQAIYFTMKTTTSLTLYTGRHALLGFYKKEKPAGTVEIFILGAEVISAGNRANVKKHAAILSRAACTAVLLLANAAGAPAAPHPAPLVRVTLLMVSMPEEKFLTLLPDLLDKDKIGKAVPGLLDAVKHKGNHGSRDSPWLSS